MPSGVAWVGVILHFVGFINHQLTRELSQKMLPPFGQEGYFHIADTDFKYSNLLYMFLTWLFRILPDITSAIRLFSFLRTVISILVWGPSQTKYYYRQFHPPNQSCKDKTAFSGVSHICFLPDWSWCWYWTGVGASSCFVQFWNVLRTGLLFHICKTISLCPFKAECPCIIVSLIVNFCLRFPQNLCHNITSLSV